MLQVVVMTHRAVMVFRADVTVLLAPADLIEATATDLTHCLMGGLVHACPNVHINTIRQTHHTI